MKKSYLLLALLILPVLALSGETRYGAIVEPRSVYCYSYKEWDVASGFGSHREWRPEDRADLARCQPSHGALYRGQWAGDQCKEFGRFYFIDSDGTRSEQWIDMERVVRNENCPARANPRQSGREGNSDRGGPPDRERQR